MCYRWHTIPLCVTEFLLALFCVFLKFHTGYRCNLDIIVCSPFLCHLSSLLSLICSLSLSALSLSLSLSLLSLCLVRTDHNLFFLPPWKLKLHILRTYDQNSFLSPLFIQPASQAVRLRPNPHGERGKKAPISLTS